MVAATLAEREAGHEALRQTAARLSEAQSIAHIGSWEWNLAATRSPGRTSSTASSASNRRTEPLTYGLVPRTGPPGRPRARRRGGSAGLRGSAAVQPWSTGSCTRTAANGSSRAADALCSRAGRARDMVGTAQDMTEQRQVEKLREDILSAVSHELRTPLTSVLGFALTLEQRRSEPTGDGRRDRLRHRPGRTQARAPARRPPRHRAPTSRAHSGQARADRRRATSCVESWRTIRSTAVWSASPEGRWQRTSTARSWSGSSTTSWSTRPSTRRRGHHRDPRRDPWRDLLLVVEDEGPGIADELQAGGLRDFQPRPERVVHDPGRRHRPRPRGALRRHPRWPDLGRGRPGGGASFHVLIPDCVLDVAA